MPVRPQIFLSHASVWTYQRDQAGDERNVGASLKERVRESVATIMLVSPETLRSGATQWMELAYADAFDVPTFVLLHRMTFESLIRRKRGVPPLVLAGHCTPAVEWRKLEQALRACCQRDSSTDARPTS